MSDPDLIRELDVACRVMEEPGDFVEGMDDVRCPACMTVCVVQQTDDEDWFACPECDYEGEEPLTIRQMLDGALGREASLSKFAGFPHACWNTVDLPAWTRLVARLVRENDR